MSSRTGQKKSDWSEWGWDEANAQQYRTRYDSQGRIEYDTRPAQTVAQETPRSKIGEDGVSQYASNNTQNTYFESDTYRYGPREAAVNALSEQFENASIGTTGKSAIAYSPSYGTTASSTLASPDSVSTGYGNVTQPIDMPTSPSKSTASGSRAYSSAYTTSWKGKAIDIGTGYFPEENTGFVSGGYNERQAATYATRLDRVGGSQYYSSNSEATASSAYGQPSFDEQQSAEFGDSGAITQDLIHKAIRGTKGDKEKLDPNYKIHHSKHFKPGQIFKVLWSEPEGETRQDMTVVTRYTLREAKYGQKVHTKIRRFVIVAADHGHCQCLPISTYQRQGATKSGINPDDHAIIYHGEPPSDKTNSEEGLTKVPIQMVPKSHRDKLEPKSLINYAKIYTVEHNVKVFFIGRIASTSEKQFMFDFDDTWNKKRQLDRSY